MSFAQEAGGVAKIRAAHEKGTALGPGERVPGEHYETPPPGTMALVDRHRPRLKTIPVIWEPCCGGGRMARVLKGELPHARLLATDVEDRGYGVGGIDFLDSDWLIGMEPETTAIIMNPPFSDGNKAGGGLAARFIRHAVIDLKADFVAVLGKAGFWNAQMRQALFAECSPTFLHPLAFRLDFTGQKRPAMEMVWSVWDRRAESWGGPSIFEPLPHPKILKQAELFPGFSPGTSPADGNENYNDALKDSAKSSAHDGIALGADGESGEEVDGRESLASLPPKIAEGVQSPSEINGPTEGHLFAAGDQHMQAHGYDDQFPI